MTYVVVLMSGSLKIQPELFELGVDGVFDITCGFEKKYTDLTLFCCARTSSAAAFPMEPMNQ